MPNSNFPEGIYYLGFGATEPFKNLRFCAAYAAASGLFSAFVYFVFLQIATLSERNLAEWYFIGCLYVSLAAGNTYLIQVYLARYRSISINRKSIGICLAWTAAFLIVGACAKHLIKILFEQIFTMDTLVGQSFLSPAAFRLAHEAITAATMVWVGFYPFLIFENRIQAFKENISLIKKSGFSLACAWIMSWYVTASLQNIIKMSLAYYFGNHPDWHLAHSIVMSIRIILVPLLLLPFTAATTAAAFLRSTGELAFLPKPATPKLTKS